MQKEAITLIIVVAILVIMAIIQAIKVNYYRKYRDVRIDKYFCPVCRRYWYKEVPEEGHGDMACPVCFCEDLRKIN